MKLLDEQILFCDNHLLALDKPAGLLCQPSGTEDISLEALGKAWLKEKFQKNGNVFLEAAHRIDRCVSGVVLFARTSKALSRLNAAQRAGNWKKTYQALVSGIVSQDQGRLIDWLAHDGHFARVTHPHEADARECRLTYQVLARENRRSLLEITLLTGRYHQIRAQLAHFGHPILGDAKYGSGEIWHEKLACGDAIALRDVRLEFPHPVGGVQMVVESRQHWA